MDRIIIHWTAGGHRANATDRRSYHRLIEGDGRVVPGNLAPEANRSVADGIYAPHTRALNTGSIGVALCAMHMAQERPFNPGPAPITPAQLTSLAREVSDLCATYRIPVTRRTVLTHAEVQRTLGVAQAGKWDIVWLPGMQAPGDPIEIGDRLRAMIEAPALPIPAPAPAAPSPDDPAALIAEATALLHRARAALNPGA